jgi:type II secretory pathway pseudopilin PulG
MSPSRKRFSRRIEATGFTLVELLVIVTIIGVLIAIGLPKYTNMVNKAAEGVTRGNLGSLRSALSIYFADNDSTRYPTDDLASLTANMKYIPAIPPVKTPPHHFSSTLVTAQVAPNDAGTWSYNNVELNVGWGQLRVACTHVDLRGQVWSAY